MVCCHNKLHNRITVVGTNFHFNGLVRWLQSLFTETRRSKVAVCNLSIKILRVPELIRRLRFQCFGYSYVLGIATYVLPNLKLGHYLYFQSYTSRNKVDVVWPKKFWDKLDESLMFRENCGYKVILNLIGLPIQLLVSIKFEVPLMKDFKVQWNGCLSLRMLVIDLTIFCISNPCLWVKIVALDFSYWSFN